MDVSSLEKMSRVKYFNDSVQYEQFSDCPDAPEEDDRPGSRETTDDRQTASERQTTDDRQAASERQTTDERLATSERQTASERQTTDERQTASERQTTDDRQTASERQTTDERQTASERQTTDERLATSERQTTDKKQTKSERQTASERQTSEKQTTDKKQTSEIQTTDSRQTSAEYGEPLWLCKIVTGRPRLCFGVTLGFHVLCVLVSVCLMMSGYDLFPVEFGTLPLNLFHQPWLRRDLAWRHRLEFDGYIARKLYDNQTVLWPRSQLSSKSLQLLYNAREGNVLTRPRLQAMQRIEDRLVHVQGYTDLCQMTRRRSCVPPLSMLRFFDGTYSAVDPVFDDPNFDNIDRIIYAAYTNNATRGKFANFLGKSHNITPTRVHVTLTRTIIPFAGSSLSEVVADTDFMLDKFQPLLVDFLESEDFEFLYYSETMMIAAAKKQGFQDMKLAIGSILFIFAFILFHTHSLWVTCLGVFSIVCSFAETNLIYRVVIGFRYFGFFHVLAMFINLGIGADDLFVFWDAWQASQLRPFPSLAHRLDDAYRKSAISMLVTSLTTTLAFFASALSPLLATMSFGVFSAILVAIDYISVIIFFPTIIIMHHLCFENNRCLRCCLPCCGCNQNTKCKASVTPNDQFTDGEDEDRNTVTDATTTAGHAAASRHSVSSCQDNTSVRTSHMNNPTSSDTTNTKYSSDTDRGGADSQTKADDTNFPISFIDTQSRKGSTVSEPRELPGTTVGAAKGGEDVVRREHRRLVVFFSDYYLRFVTHRVWRWVLLAVMMAVVVVFAVSATRLTPDDQQVGLFKESHHWSRAYRLTCGGFVPHEQESSIQLWLLWGIRERDMSACHFSNYTCIGRQQYDDTFDPSTLAAQRSFVELCDTLSNLTDRQVADLNIRRDFHSGQPKISCFTHNLHAFLREDSVLTGLDTDMPWDGAKVSHFMTSLESYYDTSIINSSYRHYLDIPVNYWLWDGFRRNLTADYAMFNELLVEERTEFTSPIPSMPSVKVGNRLKFIGVQVRLNLHYATLSYKEHLPVLKRWESLMQRQLSKMPRELQSGFQVTQVAWELLHVQKSLVDNAVMGIILGVTLALPILIVSTCNVINGVLATLTICCVTVCVIGVVPMAGWKLGVLVSLNMSLVVGLAVDYVVHLAEGYHMSQARDRKSRLMHALGTMGISVFSGACTTLGASTFMLFAQIQFFYQFGIFMFCTIGFSLVFSLGLYVTVMGIVGPEGDTGDIRVLLRACVERCKHHKLPHQR